MRAPSVALLSLLAAAPAAAADFWQHWGDGKAELSGYSLIQPRYGAPREGRAILVFVTEDFADGARVKADPGKHPSNDLFPVLKLNFIRDFQTGIYDYHIVTSTFARTEWRSGAPWPLAKVSFSAQEWCGHVYAQWLFRGNQMIGQSHSYFDGEADAQPTLLTPANGVLEDAVPILVRDLRGEWLALGEVRKVPYLPSTLQARLRHRPQAWGEATIRKLPEPSPLPTALGKLRVYRYTVEVKDGPTTTWTVEEAWPHRLLAWASSDGESGRLLGSARLPYWQLNGPGGEAALQEIGLHPPSYRAGAPEPLPRRQTSIR